MKKKFNTTAFVNEQYPYLGDSLFSERDIVILQCDTTDYRYGISVENNSAIEMQRWSFKIIS